MSTENEVNLSIVNYPPSGSEFDLRTIAFGPTGPMRLMLDMSMDEDQKSVDVDLILSNAAEHEDLRDFLRDVVEVLNIIIDAEETNSAIDAALAGGTD